MLLIDQAGQFAEDHPHYTPAWLSHLVASGIPSDFSGNVLDPACGGGNLLAAAAHCSATVDAPMKRRAFYGCDTSIRAVNECRVRLSRLFPRGSFAITQADFLRRRVELAPEPTFVLMNPPFRGYGDMGEVYRRQLARRFDLRGRYNLSHAFVVSAIQRYRPVGLISILPSNCMYSSNSAFRETLDSIGGKWEWERIGGNAFRKVDVDVGLLRWLPDDSPGGGKRSFEVELDESGYEVRHGLATGRDNSYFELAEADISVGRVVLAARGRDVARPTKPRIWVPPPRGMEVKNIRALLPAAVVKDLKGRSCVQSGRKQVYEFHENPPSWFLGTSKLLLPEICTKDVRVEVDHGAILPLHSTIAIRTPSLLEATALAQYLRSHPVQNQLKRMGPRLSGDAVRIQVGAVRRLVKRWLEHSMG